MNFFPAKDKRRDFCGKKLGVDGKGSFSSRKTCFLPRKGGGERANSPRNRQTRRARETSKEDPKTARRKEGKFPIGEKKGKSAEQTKIKKNRRAETRRLQNKAKDQNSTSSSQVVRGCQPEAEGISESRQCRLLSKLNRVQFSTEG